MIVYDLRTQPMAIGEFLSFMEVGVLRDDPDIAFSYDPLDPLRGDPALRHYVKPHAFQAHFKPFLSLTDKVLLYPGQYDWPPLEISTRPMFRHIYSEIFTQGVKPLTMKSRAWADAFMREHDVRYCVHLRHNPYHNNSSRNSPRDVWLDFFNQRKERFVLIGETDFRLKNTILAKDYGTTLEQDLALVEAADVFMGPPSGPSSMAVFNKKPYRIFNMTLPDGYIKSYTVTDNVGRFTFATDNQTCLRGRETVAIINREFDQCL